MARKGIYLDHFKGVSLFQGLNDKELRKVANAGTQIDAPAGTTLIKEGQRGHSAFVLLTGTLVVRQNGRKLREVQPGGVLGEMSLLDDSPRSATVECATDCSVFEINSGQFHAVLDEVPVIRRKVMAALAARVREHEPKGSS